MSKCNDCVTQKSKNNEEWLKQKVKKKNYMSDLHDKCGSKIIHSTVII